MEIKLPELGENIDSATVVRILVKPGDTISKDQPIMELETEKAAVDLPSSAAGTVKDIAVKEGDTIRVGQTVLTLEDSNAAHPPADARVEPPKKPASLVTEPESAQPAELPRENEAAAAPSLRRMARELGVDINTVKGTGSGGRITEDDVRSHARSLIMDASTGAPSEPTRLPDFSHWGDTERRALSGIRRKTAERMQAAWSSVPHVTQFDYADITDLESARKASARRVEDAGGKLTITAILLKFVATALKVFPRFNASIEPNLREIVLKKYCNIGVAVDTEHGLLVPVIRDVDKKNILSLSVELTQVAEKARNRKLSTDEMQGGVFTITNLGGIHGSHFTPIVNLPEVAILGVSRATVQPVFIDGEFKPRLMLPLSLSYDHRAIDGADGARFLQWIAEALENPLSLSLEG